MGIRNPHGRGAQWNGAWSEDDGNWEKNPGLKEELGAYVEADHATFWMEFGDFVKEFNNVQVCPHTLNKEFAKSMLKHGNTADEMPDRALRPAAWGEPQAQSFDGGGGGSCADRCSSGGCVVS